MSLSPGVRFGPCEVIALIGEGGMGKVWRARHKALKRDDAGGPFDKLSAAQRHLGVRAGFQVSGLYFYGSGGRQQLNPGNRDPRDLGNTGDYPNRHRVNGELAARNSLRRPSIHRVDVRFQQRIPVGPRVSARRQLDLTRSYN